METIFLLSKIDYRSRYHENKLGVLWALIRPIMEVIVYYIAFKYVLGKVADNFLVFLFLGQITWLVFVEICSGMINLLESKRYLYASKVFIEFVFALGRALFAGLRKATK